MESEKDMDIMGMIKGKKKSRVDIQYEQEEKAAEHRGRLKYLERQAAKGERSSGGFLGSLGKGLESMAGNAASNTFGDSGGGRRRRGGGSGPLWDPIGGESISAPRKHSSRHRPRHKKTMTRYRRKEVFYY